MIGVTKQIEAKHRGKTISGMFYYPKVQMKIRIKYYLNLNGRILIIVGDFNLDDSQKYSVTYELLDEMINTTHKPHFTFVYLLG